eukprot:11814348-Karenia_brevis.AAC.1
MQQTQATREPSGPEMRYMAWEGTITVQTHPIAQKDPTHHPPKQQHQHDDIPGRVPHGRH